MTLNPFKLEYKQIKENLIKQIEDFLLNGNWSALRLILKSSPKQITELEIIPLFEKRVISEEDFIPSFFFERNERKFLSESIEFILNLMAENPRIFSNNLRDFLLEKILPTSETLSGNAQEKINNALGDYLIETRSECLTDYPRLFENLVSKYPKEISIFLPKIFELKWWDLAFRLFNLVPELINLYPEYVRISIKNIFLNIYQFRNFKKILEKINISLYNTIENNLRIRFQKYFKEFKSLLEEEFTIEWVKKKKLLLSTGILFYTENELIEIIEKILEFNIEWNHQDPISSEINQFLYFIQTNKKNHLLKRYLKKFKDLGYNLIRDYIRFEKIDKDFIQELEISIFDIENQDPKINARYIDSLYGKEVVRAFKNHLENFIYRPRVISVFFKAKPELGEEFTKIIEEYYENINFGEPPSDDHTYEYSNVLFGSFGDYSSHFSPSFFIPKVKEYLSNTRNREWFNPWSMNLLNNFDKMDKDLQQDIINLLIERKRYNSLSFSLARTPEKFSKFIDQFLEMTSDNESEIRSIIGIFKLILRIHIEYEPIFEKLKNKLLIMPNTYDKGLFLSFLGEKVKALECFEESVNKEISLSQKIFILTDYILEYLDINNEDIPIVILKKLDADIEQLKKDFEYFNVIKESGRKFPFKFHFLKARFMFFLGIYYINIDDYDLSYQKLNESETSFKNLSNSKTIPLYNKEIIMFYQELSSILLTFIKRIKNLKNKNKISQLKQEFSDHIESIEFTPSSEDIKTKRIRSSLENFYFNDIGRLKQLRFELPTNFCPLPPPIESIYIIDLESMKEIHPWNHKQEVNPNFQYLNLSKNYQQFELIQDFAEKDKIYPYIIDFEETDLLKIFKYDPIYEAGKNHFKIDIKSNGFFGEREIKFCLKQNDICSVGVDLELPVKELELLPQPDTRTKRELIIESLIKCIYQFQQKIQSIRKSEDHYSVILSQFINNLIEKCGWHTEDQVPSGLSASAEERIFDNIGGLGKLDFILKDEKNMLLTICEALVLNSNAKKIIEEHLVKIFKYDTIGMPFNFIMIYSKAEKFENLWTNYQETVLNTPFKYKLKKKQFYDENEQFNIKSELRLGKTIHIRQGQPMDLYHFLINTNF